MEITLRSRVIEKLSVALDTCLFNTHHEKDQRPETDEGMVGVQVGVFFSLPHTMGTKVRGGGGHTAQHGNKKRN